MRKLALLISLLLNMNASALELEVKALFDGAALLSIEGKDTLVKAGKKTPEGVLLVQADSFEAVIEYDGKRQTLDLSTRIAASFEPAGKSQVMITLTKNNQYLTYGSINGRSVRFLVDTGANVIAMNAMTAASLGLSLDDGEQAMASTASDRLPVTVIHLKEVQVGSIRQHNVRAIIMSGLQPTEVLLGMSFLQHVDINENAGLMVLTSKL